ncbi:unnamed protein product [Amaranthus hypochondriacus]
MEYDTKCKNCKSAAWTYCRAENANFCWDCDTIAHQDNHLVHWRQLLCHKCQSRTIWYASGPKLPISMAVCYLCDPKTCGNVDFIKQRWTNLFNKKNQDHHSKLSSADTKDNDDHHMPSTTIITEHGQEKEAL